VLRIRGETTLTAAAFPPAFIIIAGIAASAAFLFAMLPAHAGAELAGRRGEARAAPPDKTPDQPEG
jgi:hypothetical protein